MSQTEQLAKIGVKQAIGIAKSYVLDAFADDGIENVGLEEVSHDDEHSQWLITIGFSRPWDQMASDEAIKFGQVGWSIQNHDLTNLLKRTYKIVRISSKNGTVARIENRPM